MKMQHERASHLMMFCALLMVKNSSATMQQSMQLVPVFGNNRHLARKLVRPSASLESTTACPSWLHSINGTASAEGR